MGSSIAESDSKALGTIDNGLISSHKIGALSESSSREGKIEHPQDDTLPKYIGTFDAIGDQSFYTPIERYEGKHRYDPEFEWEPKEEKRLVRKVRSLACCWRLHVFC